MSKLLEEHMKLQLEVLEQPKAERSRYIGEIEQFCTNLLDSYSRMSLVEQKHARVSIGCWYIIYREITGTELNVFLSSHTRKRKLVQ